MCRVGIEGIRRALVFKGAILCDVWVWLDWKLEKRSRLEGLKTDGCVCDWLMLLSGAAVR